MSSYGLSSAQRIPSLASGSTSGEVVPGDYGRPGAHCRPEHVRLFGVSSPERQSLFTSISICEVS
jgi:hypothetical protein